MSIRIPLPATSVLNHMFAYDPVTGVVTRKVANSHCVKVGERVGSFCMGGYRVRIGPTSFVLTRIIWKMVTGADPKMHIDHKDGNWRNNAWNNLREATIEQNMHNRVVRFDNKLGLKGVEKIRSGRYSAHIYVKGRQTKLGVYDTPQDAHAAYVRAASDAFGEFACSGERGTNISVLDGLPPS